jgi:hypothetical protein
MNFQQVLNNTANMSWKLSEIFIILIDAIYSVAKFVVGIPSMIKKYARSVMNYIITTLKISFICDLATRSFAFLKTSCLLTISFVQTLPSLAVSAVELASEWHQKAIVFTISHIHRYVILTLIVPFLIYISIIPVLIFLIVIRIVTVFLACFSIIVFPFSNKLAHTISSNADFYVKNLNRLQIHYSVHICYHLFILFIYPITIILFPIDGFVIAVHNEIKKCTKMTTKAGFKFKLAIMIFTGLLSGFIFHLFLEFFFGGFTNTLEPYAYTSITSTMRYAKAYYYIRIICLVFTSFYCFSKLFKAFIEDNLTYQSRFEKDNYTTIIGIIFLLFNFHKKVAKWASAFFEYILPYVLKIVGFFGFLI